MTMIDVDIETKTTAVERLAAMLDVSAVRANSDLEDVRNVAGLAREYGCVAVFSLPGYASELVRLLSDRPDINVGGVVGFPSGGETTRMKTVQAEELLRIGCTEIDMVLNIGKLLSGEDGYVENDIRAVRQAIGSVPLKVILECHYLPEDRIARAAELAVRAGADWVKTGTGWASGGTTFNQVRILKKAVGNDAKVKAAGGVRDLDTLLEMHRLGAERFGIGHTTARNILEDFRKRNEEETR